MKEITTRDYEGNVITGLWNKKFYDPKVGCQPFPNSKDSYMRCVEPLQWEEIYGHKVVCNEKANDGMLWLHRIYVDGNEIHITDKYAKLLA